MVAFVAAIVSGNALHYFPLLFRFALPLVLFWSVALIFPVSAFLFHLAVAEPPAVDDLTLNRLLYGAARLLFFLPVLLFQHWARLEYRAALLMSFVAYLNNEPHRYHSSIYKHQLSAVVREGLARGSLIASKLVWKH